MIHRVQHVHIYHVVWLEVISWWKKFIHFFFTWYDSSCSERPYLSYTIAWSDFTIKKIFSIFFVCWYYSSCSGRQYLSYSMIWIYFMMKKFFSIFLGTWYDSSCSGCPYLSYAMVWSDFVTKKIFSIFLSLDMIHRVQNVHIYHILWLEAISW